MRKVFGGQKAVVYHKVVSDGTDDGGAKVPSGVYFCSLTAGHFKLMKKMIALK